MDLHRQDFFPNCMGGKLKGSIKDKRLGTLMGVQGRGGGGKRDKYLLFDQSRVS